MSIAGKKDGREIRKGYRCDACGEQNLFSPYVYAHWDHELVHTCKCGAKYQILNGIALPFIDGDDVVRNW